MRLQPLRNTSRCRRGAALALTLLFLLVVMGVAITFVSLSMTSSKLAYQGWEKTQANELAEAGVYAMFSQIANSLAASTPTFNTAAIPATSLTSTFGSATSADGVYSATVVSNTSVTHGAQTTYTLVVEGDGTAPDGHTMSKARATFTETSSSATGNYGLQDAGITSAGNILFQGNANTSDASGKYGADAFANGTVTVQNTSTYTIDGVASAYGASPSLNTTDAKTVTPLTSPITFPNAATIAGFQSTWNSEAQETTPTYPSGQNLASYTSGPNSTLTGPAYISGDLNVQGGSTLTIQPDPAATAPYVIYVHGNINVGGGSVLINKGVLLVADGQINISGTSTAPYTASNMTTSGLVSFSTNSTQAINLSGGSMAENIGVLYAFNGGITLSGGSQLIGSATTASSSATVSLSGSQTHLYYSSGMNSSWAATSTTYTSSTLSNWDRTL